jgi:hypothetical protein
MQGRIMEKLGYGPSKRLPVTVSTRNVSYYRDPAVILIDQLTGGQMGKREPRRLQKVICLAIQMTTTRAAPPQRSETVLPPSHRGVGRT